MIVLEQRRGRFCSPDRGGLAVHTRPGRRTVTDAIRNSSCFQHLMDLFLHVMDA